MVIWGEHGASSVRGYLQLGASGGSWGSFWGQHGASGEITWGHLGNLRTTLGTTWGHLGADLLGHLYLGTTWGILGTSGESEDNLGHMGDI